MLTDRSKKEAALYQKASEQKRATVDLPAAAVKAMQDFPQRRRSVVRHHSSIQVPPDIFHWIQLRGIRRQPLHHQPTLLPRFPQVGLGPVTAMCGQAIQEEGDRSGKLPVESLNHLDHLGTLERTFLKAQAEEDSSAGRSAEQSPGRGEALPIEVVNQNRRAPAPAPGPANGGFLGETALVQENQARAAFPGFFLIAGQVRVFQ